MMNFEEWYEQNNVSLKEKYYELHPEDYPTDDSLCEVESDSKFQNWCEEQYKEGIKG